MILIFGALDGVIVLLYTLVAVGLGLWMRKYVKGVDDFLVAGRKVDLHLGIASLAATEFGIVTCMANAELGYKYGFAGITPGIALFLAMYIVGVTGFCIKPLREQGVITLPEFFEDKFGKQVRWSAGVVIVLGGLLNMGVFLRMGGEFLSAVIGFEEQYLEVVMTVILLLVALYTLLGGMMSVLVTDYLQFIFMSLGLISVSVFFLLTHDWNEATQHLEISYGESAFNPFASGGYGLERILFDLFIAFSSILTWQTMISRVLSAKNAQTGQKIYKGTSPFFLVRFAIPAFLGVIALHYFSNTDGMPSSEILALPELLTTAVPVGLLGLLVAAMLAADMSTNSSYMIAWSSVIYNDILFPWHKGQWSAKKGLRTNRILIACIGMFLLLYGLWYPLQGDLWVYLQVTGTIYLASMSVLLIAACYWKGSNSWGAIAAISTGAIVPLLYLILQQVPSTNALSNSIGPYWAGNIAFVLTAMAMWIGSSLKPKAQQI